jgi:hypothetical protein
MDGDGTGTVAGDGERRRVRLPKTSIERWVFWPAAAVVIAFSGFALLAPCRRRS